MDLKKAPLRANVELKARVPDPDAALRMCRLLGAEDQGEEQQVDTYFTMGRYRLKLRESSRRDHHLIGYSRPDEPGARKSQYRILPVVAPRSVKSTLSRQWGVKAVVKKRRHLFIWDGHVRIHLDQVEGLGSFLEFEAVLDAVDADADDGDEGYGEDSARLDVARLRHDFAIDDDDLVETSYGTLMKARGNGSGDQSVGSRKNRPESKPQR